MEGNESRFRLFLSMSALLTGYAEFDLHGTGCAKLYFETVSGSTARQTLDELLSEWEGIEKRLKSEKGRMDALVKALNANKVWMTLAQNITMLWYMGQWTDPGTNASLMPSGLAYLQGFAWVAMDAHVEGGNEEGFAMWATKPGTTQF